MALVLASYFGSWEWALIGFVVLITMWWTNVSVFVITTTLVVSFIWLAVFHWTGDRRMFFPFSMQFAVQMPYLLEGRVARPAIMGGGGMVLIFLLVRVIQSATASVLLVEVVVALAILGLVAGVGGSGPAGLGKRLAVGAIGSALALAGLAL